MSMQKQLAAMSMKDLVALYNRNTGGSVKRFASRAVGERRVLESMPKKSTGHVGAGRPFTSFKITLTNGATKVHHMSARAKMLDWLRSRNGSATIQEAADKFGKEFDIRGTLYKLERAGWIKREPLA